MHTTDRTEAMGRQRRRRHSAAFKAESIAACRQPGVSIAAVAMSRSLNANLLRRWVVAAERQEAAPRWRLRSKSRRRGLRERLYPLRSRRGPASGFDPDRGTARWDGREREVAAVERA